MNLDEAQKAKVSAWIEEGLKLSEIQSRMISELGLRLTYMDVRFLVDDLKLVPKDIERPKPAAGSIGDMASAGSTAATPVSGKASDAGAGTSEAPSVPGPGGVSIAVDQLARPGTVVSGQVTFSDGNKADWYIDQTGRLGLAPQVTGYRPAAADVQQFQLALEAELSRLGL
jgi:hypothetical protein